MIKSIFTLDKKFHPLDEEELSCLIKGMAHKAKKNIYFAIHGEYASEKEINSFLEELYQFKWNVSFDSKMDVYSASSFREKLIKAGKDFLLHKRFLALSKEQILKEVAEYTRRWLVFNDRNEFVKFYFGERIDNLNQVLVSGGIRHWHSNGIIHRIDGPAVECGDYKAWYFNGKLHREDGPAVECGDHKAWYLNGKLHRADGPTYENSNYKVWYLNGELHRVDGPAFEDGTRKEWYLNGKRHREDGPAIENGDHKEYWLNGVRHESLPQY